METRRVATDTFKLSNSANSVNNLSQVNKLNEFENGKATFASNTDKLNSNTQKLSVVFKDFPVFQEILDGKNELKAGDKGNHIIALQKALLMLKQPEIKVVDGKFGKNELEKALISFQHKNGLEETGTLNKGTLMKLNESLNKETAKPMKMLPQMSSINLDSKSWNDSGLQKAYGQFVKERWEYLKSQVVETDCKGLALKFMVDFRDFYKEQTGIDLPFPGGKKGIKEFRPSEFNSENTKGWSEKLPNKSKRNDYDNFTKIQEAFPDESLIKGTNYSFPIHANTVAKNMVKDIDSREGQAMVTDHPANMKHEERKKHSEVNINQLEAGDLIFIDHTDKGKSWDHTVNIVDVQKRDDGSVSKVVIAVAAFDDLFDRTSATKPKFPNINLYAEEVTLEYDKQGNLTSDNVTWSSEPEYMHASRYSIDSTLMELKNGGKLKVAKWSD